MTSSRLLLAAMTLSAVGLVTIVLNEGYTDRAVIPVKGDTPTLGFGTTEGVQMGDTTTPPKALVRALADVSKFEGALKRCIKVPLHQGEYDSFVSLSYNIGPKAFCNSTLAKKLNAGDYAAACAEISRWTYFQGKDCKDPANRCSGLAKRRASERAMCEGR